MSVFCVSLPCQTPALDNLSTLDRAPPLLDPSQWYDATEARKAVVMSHGVFLLYKNSEGTNPGHKDRTTLIFFHVISLYFKFMQVVGKVFD